LKRLYTLLAAALCAVLCGGILAYAVHDDAKAKTAKIRYTAIAVAPSLIWGAYSDGYTKNQAQTNALAYCRKVAADYSAYRGDCQGASWVKNGHVALAFEKTIEQPYKNLQWGSDWEYGKSFAKQGARQTCYYKANEACKDKLWRRTPALSDNVYTKGGTW
jgi:hypothetical protein